MFLLKIEITCFSADVRTSLLTSKAARERKIEEKQQKSQALNVFKPKKVIENENRSKALNTAISVENKGFTLMQKMGYKPGTAIGKSGLLFYTSLEFNNTTFIK